MNVKKYIKDHKRTIKKVIIVGVPTAAGIAIGCRAGFIPYKQVAGAAVKAGRKIPLNKIPVRQIGMKAKDGIVTLAGTDAVAKAGQTLKHEIKREVQGEARRIIRRKIKDVQKVRTEKRQSSSQVGRASDETEENDERNN